jgi:putative pyruvate formate lyase activating enzyme
MLHKSSYEFLTADDWDGRIREADCIASSCTLCPRQCRVNRLTGNSGFCKAPNSMLISSIFPHYGEEPPVSGTCGSGTVFFSCCTLRCCFCQNYQISHNAEGEPYSPHELAEAMIDLQNKGCHNINLVTATHFLPWVLRALKEAAGRGLTIPIVYNNGGYELPDTLRLLHGIVDIYLPDMKYGTNEEAARYSQADDYVEVNQRAVIEMFRQVGPLRMDANGIAYRGMCIRHLVLPGNRAHSEKILDFLNTHFDPEDISLSLMAQYRPMFNAARYEELSQPLCDNDYSPIKKQFLDAGFCGYVQDIGQLDTNFCIDFSSRKNEALTGK